MSNAAAYAGSVPEHYENHLGPILFEPYARDLAARLPGGCTALLELACGTGRLTRHLLDHLVAGGRLVATDLNADMIAVAQRQLSDHRLEWRVANAQELPFQEGLFDAVLCGFGLMFFPDKARALGEAYRVLRPGGSILFNTWDSMAQNPRAAIIADVMQEALGAAAPDFLSAGPYSLFDVELLQELLRGAGFQDIRIEHVALESKFNDPEAIVSGYVDGSPLGQYLDKKSADLRDGIKERLRAALEKQRTVYGDRVPMKALVLEARK